MQTRLSPAILGGLLVLLIGLPVAIHYWRAVFAEPPDTSLFDAHLAAGQSSLEAREYPRALMAFDRARQLEPTSAAAQLGLMRTRLVAAAAEPGRIEAAVVAELTYEASILLEVEPEQRALWLTAKGNAEASSGQLAAAKTSLEAAASADPQSAYAQAGLGLLHLRMSGQRDAGRAYLERAVELDPTHAPALLPLAQLALGDGDVRRAAELAEVVLKGGDNPAASQLLKQCQGVRQAR